MNKSEEAKIQSGAAGHVSRWSVVETNNRQEKLAKFHLERRGLVAYLPMRAVPKKRVGLDTAAPLFPSYLFVQVDEAGCCWADVFGAIGVRSVLGVGGKPRVAPVGLVEAIKGREVYGLVQMKEKSATMPHRPGDRVQIMRGAFADFDAIFEEALDANRVMVLLNLFGRKARVAVALTDVRRAS